MTKLSLTLAVLAIALALYAISRGPRIVLVKFESEYSPDLLNGLLLPTPCPTPSPASQEPLDLGPLQST